MLYHLPNKDLELASLKRELSSHSSTQTPPTSAMAKRKSGKKRPVKRAQKVYIISR